MTNHVPRRAVSSLDVPDVPEWRLWFGLLAAPSAWVAQGGLGWFFGERICTSMSIRAVRATIGVVSILAIIVTLAGLLTAWRNWQTVSGDIDAWDRVVFMSIGGIIVSASFLVATIWAGLIPAMIGACGGMR